ncbi:MAG: argininosuccinate lyase [Deltaproteobacteria bacterium]|nr:argininosuccinate lyase [Deltaproteobacteria bacterium]MCB9788161.1 argininosuccinate lyase [Deltaproteobacteria bacterium]
MAGGDQTKAWGGRFSEGTHASVEAMNASIAFDRVLAIEDIAGSVAHARMLLTQGLLDADEHRMIESGLEAIATEIRAGRFEFTVAREDVHMNVEGALADAIGPTAGRLHTGRSRNDQVALDLRLWLRRELTALGEEVAATVEALLALATTHAEVPMPGYTHLQRAQPVTFGHHMMAYAAMYLRDLDRLLDARRRTAVLPLGSGALAASPLPLDRHRVAAELEMPDITLNSLDGVSDRDAALESLAALSILMVHTSRLAEELVLWASQEFAFIEISDAFCTGSSLMPQKKNPDIPELLRGKAGRVFGALQALLVTMKGLPLAYNKDMQEDKEPVIDAFATARVCMGILPALLGAIRVRPERLMAALADGFLLATDLADHLVEQGVPFREAHHVVGAAVGLCLERGCRLEDLDIEALRSLHTAFGDDALSVLDPARSLARRDLPGGPAPGRVRESIERASAALEGLRERLAEAGPSALERALHAGTPLPPPKG